MGKDLKGKELGSGIRQKANGTYSGRYTDRFGKRKELYNKNLRQLKIDLEKAKYEDKMAINIVDTRITLNEWYKKFIDVHKHGVICANTKRHYDNVYNKHISPTLGMFRLNEVTQLQIKSLIKKLDKNGFKYETQNKVRLLLMDMFEKAMIDNFVIKNPAKGIKVVRNEEFDRKILSKEEQREFLSCSNGTFYHEAFVVLINTGLRIGELCALTMDDIDLEKNTIRVNKNLLYQKLDGDEKKTFHLGPTKTKSSVRKVPMNTQCKNAIIKQIKRKEVVAARGTKKVDEQFRNFLFVTKHNTPLCNQNMLDAIYRIIDEINDSKDDLEQMERFSSHTFRHTFATNCLEDDIPLKVVQKYLGHATMKMTADLYVHVSEEFSESQIEKLVGVDMEYDEAEWGMNLMEA